MSRAGCGYIQDSAGRSLELQAEDSAEITLDEVILIYYIPCGITGGEVHELYYRRPARGNEVPVEPN